MGQRLGSAHCLFLTGGSTQGVLPPLPWPAARGTRCWWTGAVTVRPSTPWPCWTCIPATSSSLAPGGGGRRPPLPRDLEEALEAHPAVRRVCDLPTYYGVCSDLPALARICHAHGALLLVDAGPWGPPALSGGPEASPRPTWVVVSAHKTLPARGRPPFSFSSRFSLEALRRAASLYGSSSPSYPMMAALDAARAWMEGRAALRQTAARWRSSRRRFPALTPDQAPLDPARLVLRCADGFAAEKALPEPGVYPGDSGARHVVFICTAADTEADFSRLEEALSAVWAAQPPLSELPPLPPAPAPEQALSPRQARFSSTRSLPVGAALGEIAASQVAPYPPGVPVLAPGERVTKKTIAYLSQIGYNMEKDMEVVLP